MGCTIAELPTPQARSLLPWFAAAATKVKLLQNATPATKHQYAQHFFCLSMLDGQHVQYNLQKPCWSSIAELTA
jgi:hypothetical protein